LDSTGAPRRLPGRRLPRRRPRATARRPGHSRDQPAGDDAGAADHRTAGEPHHPRRGWDGDLLDRLPSGAEGRTNRGLGARPAGIRASAIHSTGHDTRLRDRQGADGGPSRAAAHRRHREPDHRSHQDPADLPQSADHHSMIGTPTIDWTEANQQFLAAELARLKAQLSGADTTAAEASVAEARAALALPGAIDRLAGAFGLSAFERDLLLLCAGVEMDAELAAHCAAAHGIPGRCHATFGLALAALTDPHWSA